MREHTLEYRPTRDTGLGNEYVDVGLPLLQEPEAPHAYVTQVMSDLTTGPEVACAREREHGSTPTDTADMVFGVLTRREFSYLSRSRAQSYHAATCSQFARDVRQGSPLRLYYDIGGGYHASIDPATLSPTFAPGLGELLVLRQIKRFDAQIRAIYPPGTRFTLVIDNLCALLVNDIPLARTEHYCRHLRALIRNVRLDDLVDVLVESEHFTSDSYQSSILDTPVEQPSAADVENVARFLGRPCDRQEAMERIARYRVVTGESERHLETVIEGVHMTQRATPSTFGFRPFPGGDSRIQAGEVALRRRSQHRLLPFLLTSRSFATMTVRRVDVAELPAPLGHVLFAEPH